MAIDKTNIDAVTKTILDQGYKYCCLQNSSSQTLLPYNRISSDKNGAAKKLAEIKKRLTALPDGQYFINCKNSFSFQSPGDLFPIIKGTGTPMNEQIQPMLNLHIPPNKGDGNKVMTYQEALILTQENATMKAECAFLRTENIRLQAELAAHKTQLSEAPEQPVWQEWVDNTLPSLMPVVDRFMGMEERKLALKENEQRYKYSQQKAAQQQPRQMQIPQAGTEEFEQWLNWIESLDDKQYESVMLYLHKMKPDIYEIVYNEFEGEEGPEQAQEQPQEEQQAQ